MSSRSNRTPRITIASRAVSFWQSKDSDALLGKLADYVAYVRLTAVEPSSDAVWVTFQRGDRVTVPVARLFRPGTGVTGKISRFERGRQDVPDTTAERFRSQANGVLGLLGGVGGIIGTLALAGLFGRAAVLPYLAAAGLLLVTVVVVLVVPERRDAVEDTDRPGDVRRTAVLTPLAIFFWSIGYNALETFFSSWAVATLGVDAGAAGRLFAIALGVFILSSVPAGVLGARIGRRAAMVIGVGFFVAASALLFVGVVTPGLVLVGLAVALLITNSLPLLLETATASTRGATIGLYSVAFHLAAVAGPILNGIAVDATGTYAVIFIVAPICFLLAVPSLIIGSEPVILAGGDIRQRMELSGGTRSPVWQLRGVCVRRAGRTAPSSAL